MFPSNRFGSFTFQRLIVITIYIYSFYFKNFQIGKKKSVAPSRVATGQTKKIDPVTARILSAHHKRRAAANNKAGMIKVENEKLQNELKSLRIQCKRQEKVLKNYEDNQSSLPQGMEIILKKSSYLGPNFETPRIFISSK